MTLNIDELRRLAEAATPGHWLMATWYGADEGGWAAIGPHHTCLDGDVVEDDYPGGPVEERAERDARFIAAACPATVLALLDRLAAAEALLRDVASSIRTHRTDTFNGGVDDEALWSEADRIAAHLAGKEGA